MREQSIQNQIRKRLKEIGWSTRKTHGNKFQAGWPDLYCYHREYGERWLEVKTPTGRLTKAQRKEFPLWEADGIKIWIAESAEDVPELLFEEPNWRNWYDEPETLEDIYGA